MAKKPTGRPSKYTPELLEAAREYANGGWAACGDVIPTAVGLALDIGIDKSTAYAWAKQPDKAEFYDILRKVEGKQERILANSGLEGHFSPPIAKMMMTKHGYSDRIETDNKHDVSDPMKELLGFVAGNGGRVGDAEPDEGA